MKFVQVTLSICSVVSALFGSALAFAGGHDDVAVQLNSNKALFSSPGAGQRAGGGGGDFEIIVDYTGSGFDAAQQTVFNAAITMWESVIRANGGSERFRVYPILGNGCGGAACNTVNFTDDAGIPTSADVNINGAMTWFVDPTPFDNSEYTRANPFHFTNGSGDARNIDLLSVILHELGHALGWSRTYARFWELLEFDGGGLFTFDPGGFSVTVECRPMGGCHADWTHHPNDLMTRSATSGRRELISPYATMTPLQRAFNYTMPLTFLDAGYSDTSTGTASQPFDTFLDAITSADAGDTLIIKAGSYPLAATQIISKELLLWPVGGTAIVGE